MMCALLCLSIPFVLVHAGPFTASPTGLTDADFERGRSVVPSSNVDTSLTEGDIEFPQGMSGTKGSDRQRNAVRSEGKRWEHGRVPLVLDAAFTEAERANIAWAMIQVIRQSCVTFMPKTDADTDYVEVANIGTCRSYVGKIGGMQQMELGTCKGYPGAILHELMHVLGFYHEHVRNDRDNWVTIFFDNIRPGYENDFEKQSLDDITHLGTEYDYGSILHYSELALAVRFAPTISPRIRLPAGVRMGQREHLSETDVRKINLLYKCYNDSEVSEPASTTKEPFTEVATTVVRECVDHYEGCSILFHYYCTSENERERNYTREKCPKTCQVEEICGPSVVKPTNAPIDPESKCVDLDEMCPSLKYYCNTVVTYDRIAARRKCPKTCQVEESCGSTEAPIG